MSGDSLSLKLDKVGTYGTGAGTGTARTFEKLLYNQNIGKLLYNQNIRKLL